MRSPLDRFAERIVRNQEVVEFIQGLVAMGVPPKVIVQAAVSYERHSGGTSGFLPPLPGADPHDPDGGHDTDGH